MAGRPTNLQNFLDQLFDALMRGPAVREAHRCVGRVFTALTTYRAPGQNTPLRLPACVHLAPALANARPTHAALVESFAALEPHLTWTKRAQSHPSANANFLDGHANALIVGPGGYEERDDAWIGVSLLAPDVRYPDHNHPPEETYIALSEGKFQHGDEEWHEPGIGGTFYNTPDIRHAMASGDKPFFAIWCLPIGERPPVTPPKFKQFDTVRYQGPTWLSHDLRAGDRGAILEVHGDGYYEVQFDYPDGVTNKVVSAFPEQQLDR
ncbi:MAG: dimethylsulfonioproprionate lyase family protein [Pseudomonadota bacterium]